MLKMLSTMYNLLILDALHFLSFQSINSVLYLFKEATDCIRLVYLLRNIFSNNKI